EVGGQRMHGQWSQYRQADGGVGCGQRLRGLWRVDHPRADGQPVQAEALSVVEEDRRGRAVDLEDVTRAAQDGFSLCDNGLRWSGSKTIFTAPREPAVAACSMASR